MSKRSLLKASLIMNEMGLRECIKENVSRTRHSQVGEMVYDNVSSLIDTVCRLEEIHAEDLLDDCSFHSTLGLAAIVGNNRGRTENNNSTIESRKVNNSDKTYLTYLRDLFKNYGECDVDSGVTVASDRKVQYFSIIPTSGLYKGITRAVVIPMVEQALDRLGYVCIRYLVINLSPDKTYVHVLRVSRKEQYRHTTTAPSDAIVDSITYESSFGYKSDRVLTGSILKQGKDVGLDKSIIPSGKSYLQEEVIGLSPVRVHRICDVISRDTYRRQPKKTKGDKPKTCSYLTERGYYHDAMVPICGIGTYMRKIILNADKYERCEQFLLATVKY